MNKIIKISGLLVILLFTFFEVNFLKSSGEFTFPSSNIVLEGGSITSGNMAIISAYSGGIITPSYSKNIRWDVFLNGNKIYEYKGEKLIFYPEVAGEYIVILNINNTEVSNKIIIVSNGDTQNSNPKYDNINIFTGAYSGYKNRMLIGIANMPIDNKIKFFDRFSLNEGLNGLEKIQSFSAIFDIDDINDLNKRYLMNILSNIIELNNIENMSDTGSALETLQILSLIKNEENINQISSAKLYPILSLVDNSLLSDLGLINKKAEESLNITGGIIEDKAVLFPNGIVGQEIVIQSGSGNTLNKIIIPNGVIIKKEIDNNLKVTWQNAIIDPITNLSTVSSTGNLYQISSGFFNIKNIFSFGGSKSDNIYFENGEITLVIPKGTISNIDVNSLKLKYYNYKTGEWKNDQDVRFEISPSNPNYLIISHIKHTTEFALGIDNITPVASFTSNKISGNAPLSVTFSASGSYDQDGLIAEYKWYIGNTNIGSGTQITYVFNNVGSNIVTLIVKDNYGITNSKTMQISILNSAPIANFTMDINTSSGQTNVKFDATNSYDIDGNIVYYEWDFGDSTKGAGKQLYHAFHNIGTYNISLKVTDSSGLEDIKTGIVTVTNEAPIARIKVANSSGLLIAPYTGTFDANFSYDSDGTITSYEWDFGDSTPKGVGKNVSHVFDKTGDFNVILTIKDNKGAVASASYPISILPNRKENSLPNASFTMSHSNGKAPITVSFNASQSTDSDGRVISYKWYFGDISTGDGKEINHTYVKPGDYKVRLEVTDDIGGIGFSEKHISISGTKPTAEFYTTGTGNSLIFNAGPSKDESFKIVGYHWNFSDKQTGSGKIVKHNFENNGDYEVVLTITNEVGLTGTVVKKISTIEKKEETKTAISPLSDISTQIKRSTNTTPSNSSSSSSSSSSSNNKVVKKIKPIASFTATPNSGTSPLKVIFDATGSKDEDGKVTSFYWNFGDRKVGQGAKIEHIFSSPGNYEVELVVSDNTGQSGRITSKITVNKNEHKDKTETGEVKKELEKTNSGISKIEKVINQPLTPQQTDQKIIGNNPVAEFTAIPNSGSSPLSVTFSAGETGNITGYNWDFGDSNKGTGKEITHIFEKEGNYAVTLIVTNKSGGSDMLIKEIEVYNKEPILSFNISTRTKDNLDIDFDAGASKDEDGNITSYEWYFGDFKTGSGKVINHKYDLQGNYIVTLIVKDNKGGSAMIIKNVTIKGTDKPVLNNISNEIIDIDLDKKITINDFFMFVRKYGDKNDNKTCDINNDSKKDDLDVKIFTYLYNKIINN